MTPAEQKAVEIIQHRYGPKIDLQYCLNYHEIEVKDIIEAYNSGSTAEAEKALKFAEWCNRQDYVYTDNGLWVSCGQGEIYKIATTEVYTLFEEQYKK